MIPFIKEKLAENWILKITAIFLAWILWLFIQGERGPETVTTVTAPVEVQVPEGMEISGGLPSNVQVIIHGTGEALTCNINLQNAKEGENRITLTEAHIKSPKGFGIRVSRVIPSQITLMLEKTLPKQVDITVPVQGEVEDGFEVYEKITDPKRISIKGPRSHIKNVEEVSTEVIDLNGLRQDTIFRVGLNFKDGLIRSSIFDPIRVEIRIGPRRKMYVVKETPLFLEDESYVFSPKMIDIQVMAPELLRSELVPSKFKASIITQGLNGTDLSVKVKPVINFQEDWKGMIKVLGTIPSEVTISKNESP